MKRQDEFIIAQGKALREIRTTLTQLSITDVSKLVGKSRSWLSDIEIGDSNLYFDDAKKLCKIYGIDLGYLSKKIDEYL